MNPPDTPTVFVIDDDASVRASIQGLLKSARLGCASFGTAEEFLRNKPPDGPSCLVLDVSLPGVNGLELQRSEEHTSELQSRLHLVCRLLLEKKKKQQTNVLTY